MQISVNGDQQVRVAPERAEVSLTVRSEGTDRAKVIAEATASANEIGRELEAFKASDAVERYTVQPLRTYAWKKNRTSAERFTASVSVVMTFTDFEELGRYTADLGGRPLVSLSWVNWLLTDATANRLRDECIAGAVERARQRAEAMAKAAEAGPIEIIEIADPGMLSMPSARMDFGGGMRGAYAMAAKAEPEAVQIVPEEIEIGASLQLRFATKS